MSTEFSIRDEFLTPVSPRGLKFAQVSARDNQTGHVGPLYVAKWTADSKTFVFVREAADDGAHPAGIWRCDTESNFEVAPVIEFPEGEAHGILEPRGKGQCVAALMLPDGSGVIHIHHVADTFELRFTSLDGARTETWMTSPATIASRWMSISADSERVAFGVFLGDGRAEGAPWATRVFDLKKRSWWDLELGNQFRRQPGTYSRCKDPERSHFLTTSMPAPKMSDGSWLTPPDGSWRWKDLPKSDPLGDATLVYHDVTGKWGIMPLGRNGSHISSHATWRGEDLHYVAAMYHTGPNLWRAPFIETRPYKCGPEHYYAGHNAPGAEIVDLSRHTTRADSCHFDFDRGGRHFVSDTDGYVNPGPNLLYVGAYVEAGDEPPFVLTKFLGITRASWRWKKNVQHSHPHPCLSPDGRYALFQSDFFGRPQVFVAWDFEFPEPREGRA